MSKRMRDAALHAHNEHRVQLAMGQVWTTYRGHHEKFPQAANMRRMEYSCSLEKKARNDILKQGCKKIPDRITFNDTERNYRYIDARFQNYILSRSPEKALAEAAEEWWKLHLYNNNFTDLTPQPGDFPTIPFLLMANAATDKIGCAVDLCTITTNFHKIEKYYFVLCHYEENGHVKVGEPLYTEGPPCSECPDGYECDEEKILCRRKRK
ncbi:SCP-like protein [Teladorsagia circumcincta]|uniref:SCP-like protein n=1 Tax=Teladorsagia circumcincta TaxID=45464 RepID=A0A2G9U842_TELCI|nr:SCP-like protein [Teladorsagia circumcincta]